LPCSLYYFFVIPEKTGVEKTELKIRFICWFTAWSANTFFETMNVKGIHEAETVVFFCLPAPAQLPINIFSKKTLLTKGCHNPEIFLLHN